MSNVSTLWSGNKYTHVKCQRTLVRDFFSIEYMNTHLGQNQLYSTLATGSLGTLANFPIQEYIAVQFILFGQARNSLIHTQMKPKSDSGPGY